MSLVYSTYDAKARFSEVLRHVREGRTVTISYRGDPVAEIHAIRKGPRTIEERLRELERRGILVDTGERQGPYRAIERRPGALARFLEDREDRAW
ncbi:MAG: type II toxin-antitoxin system prevent-host-death family antitoxin [Gemmatimonadota bacterium]|nr:type II toxin-antitoxin system prevent-host-death family antitoxin [bacterium]MDE2874520.1 type II toxin-antitoxin system prevent-host-death family antitoxin [Gemmatimonadota bacterium]